jgi:hypothetical protein
LRSLCRYGASDAPKFMETIRLLQARQLHHHLISELGQDRGRHTLKRVAGAVRPLRRPPLFGIVIDRVILLNHVPQDDESRLIQHLDQVGRHPLPTPYRRAEPFEPYVP